MRRHPVGEVEIHLVHITPAPSLGRVIALDDGVGGRVEMLGRMAIGRVIATTDMAAGASKAQMHPPRPGLEAFLAAVGTRRDVDDGMIMRAGIGHPPSLSLPFVASTPSEGGSDEISVLDHPEPFRRALPT